MNPLPMVLADLRASRFLAPFVVLLIAISVAFGVLISAQERALRKASAAIADDFDLMIGAPGSPSQMVLTGIYLQPEALPLMEGGLLSRLSGDKRVKGVAPLVLGDSYRNYPIIGTASAFVTRWGRLPLAEGRNFAASWEAVIGADVRLVLGEAVAPSHGHGEGEHGHETPEDAAHRHEGVHFDIVGRLSRTHSPWDRAILVPISGFWATHGLGPAATLPKAHAFHQREPQFEQWSDMANLPGVPLIVVKPNSIADAYGLRAAYRQNGTLALFPAEVLTALYGLTGNMRDVLIGGAFLNTTLVMAAIVLLLWALAAHRRERYAMLRALGAPRLYLFAVIWLGAVVLLGLGAALGLGLGWLASLSLSGLVATMTGIDAPFIFAWADVRLVLALMGLASLLALGPALSFYALRLGSVLR